MEIVTEVGTGATMDPLMEQAAATETMDRTATHPLALPLLAILLVAPQQ